MSIELYFGIKIGVVIGIVLSITIGFISYKMYNKFICKDNNNDGLLDD